jgi:UDP-N-acetylmuramoylalanine--D-glutamate ligase
MEIAGKKISIIGAERSGIGAAKLIKRLGGIPFVSDSADESKLKKYLAELRREKIKFETGSHTEKIFDADLVIASPGVPSDAPVLLSCAEKNLKVISEIELASAFCKGTIIAITGTNGKTTTTALTAHLINSSGKKCYEAGNIGTAFSELVLDVNEDEYVSLEVSSFQLDLIDKFKPKIAAILNVTPDHLNRYENKFENYITSKLRIYKNQDATDYLIINADNKTLIDSLTLSKGRTFYFSLNKPQVTGAYISDNKNVMFSEDGEIKFTVPAAKINLRGEHNYQNAMAAICIAKILKMDDEGIKKGLADFKGVEHRLELVREIEGVKFINDSKATNIDSVWYALKSFDEPIFLILGGQDKGNDYNQIKKIILKRVQKIFAIGSSAEKIFNFFHKDVKVEIKKTLEEAVSTANKEARSGMIVLLSPACASFDMFENYEHRGRVFKEAVNNL